MGSEGVIPQCTQWECLICESCGSNFELRGCSVSSIENNILTNGYLEMTRVTTVTMKLLFVTA